jgi:hypothetical protein
VILEGEENRLAVRRELLANALERRGGAAAVGDGLTPFVRREREDDAEDDEERLEEYRTPIDPATRRRTGRHGLVLAFVGA